ncbi:MAG: PH domain-containing protein [Acidobacteriota bacterium]
MHETAKEALLRLLRVPAEPKPPDGTPESVRVFRAGRNYYRWRLLQWVLLQAVIGLPILILWLVPGPRQDAPIVALVIWRTLAVVSATTYVLLLPVTYIKQRLDYEMRWYIVTDRSLRVRSGIWSVDELTMTFANIQDIRVMAGPLQRFLGLADVQVTSAGGGGGGPHEAPNAHMANLAGVDCAEAIRDLMIERLRRYRDAGLGDPDDGRKATAARALEPGQAVEAARCVLEEARALRAVLS